MAGNDSDVRYFSALLVLAIFAIPAVGGACLFRSECPARAPACHEDESQQADPLCCDVLAARLSKEQNLETESSSVLAAGSLGVLRAAVAAVEEPVRSQPSQPPSGITPLFIIHSSYLL